MCESAGPMNAFKGVDVVCPPVDQLPTGALSEREPRRSPHQYQLPQAAFARVSFRDWLELNHGVS